MSFSGAASSASYGVVDTVWDYLVAPSIVRTVLLVLLYVPVTVVVLNVLRQLVW